MNELHTLYYHLNSSQAYLERKWYKHATMDLTQSIRILRLLKNDYSDALQMFKEVSAILDMIKTGYMSGNLKRYIHRRLDEIIDESGKWCEVRMRA